MKGVFFAGTIRSGYILDNATHATQPRVMNL